MYASVWKKRTSLDATTESILRVEMALQDTACMDFCDEGCLPYDQFCNPAARKGGKCKSHAIAPHVRKRL